MFRRTSPEIKSTALIEDLDVNRIELEYLPNTIESWAIYFEEIGITTELMIESFPDDLPILHVLHANCLKLLKICYKSTFVQFNQPANAMLLHSLSQHKQVIQKLLDTPNLANINKFQYLSPVDLLCITGAISSLEELRDKFPDFSDYLSLMRSWSIGANFNALKNLLTEHPDVIKQNNVTENTILHYAALSGDVDFFNNIFNHLSILNQELTNGFAQTKNSTGETILHKAAMSGSYALVNKIMVLFPNLEHEITNDSYYFYHYAAINNPELLESLLSFYDLKAATNKSNLTILHIAAQIGHYSMINYILNKYPELATAIASNNRTFLHCLIDSHNMFTLNLILKRVPKLAATRINKLFIEAYGKNYLIAEERFKSKNYNLLFYAIEKKNTPAILLIGNMFPELLNDYTPLAIDVNSVIYSSLTVKLNIVHLAIMTNCINTLQAVISLYPRFITQVNAFMIKIAAYSPNSLTYLFENFPKQAHQTFGFDFPYLTPTEIKAVDKTIINLVKRIIIKTCNKNQPLNANDLIMLSICKELLFKIFKTDNFDFLKQQSEDNFIQYDYYPSQFQNEIKKLDNLLKIKMLPYWLRNTQLTKDCFKKILEINRKARKYTMKSGKFYRELLVFVTSLPADSNELSEVEQNALIVIITDKQKKIAANKKTTSASNYLDELLINALFATKTLSSFAQKQDKAHQIELKKLYAAEKSNPGITLADNLQEHFNSVKESVDNMPACDDKTTMKEHILVGINQCLNHQDTIIAFIRSNPSDLYMLTHRLPLHTQDVSKTHPEEFKVTLDTILINFFGAYKLAKDRFLLNDFFSKLCQGFCLEARTSSAFTWVVENSQTKSFNLIMQEAYRAHTAYQKMVEGKPDYGLLSAAFDFISKRYEGMRCTPDPKLAPSGRVTNVNVMTFLVEALELDNNAPEKLSPNLQFLHDLNIHYANRWSIKGIFSKSLGTALASLRIYILDAGEAIPTKVIIDTWLTKSTIPGKLNQDIISRAKLYSIAKIQINADDIVELRDLPAFDNNAISSAAAAAAPPTFR